MNVLLSWVYSHGFAELTKMQRTTLIERRMSARRSNVNVFLDACSVAKMAPSVVALRPGAYGRYQRLLDRADQRTCEF